MEKSKDKNLNILGIILSIIIIGIAVFFASYYFFMHKSLKTYRDNLNIQIKNINEINVSVKKFIDLTDLNTKQLINTMQKNISSLQSNLYNIRNLNPTEKYSDDHKNLINGVENNILIYKQVISTVKNKESLNLNSFLDTLEKYKSDTINYYSSVSIKKVKIKLPNETINFLIDFKKHIQKLMKTNVDNEISKKQTTNFIDYLNDIMIKFNNFKTDYIGNIKQRLTSTGYSSLLNDIAENESALSALKANLSILTIPKTGTPTYEAFTKTLESYHSYIENLKYNLNTEQLTYSSDVIKKDSINKLYESSREDFENVEKNYRKFLDLFNKYKNS
ncbi:hypothetical protein FDC62_09715 [Clostridium botulinum]|uniref:hypothetical protein n=1 Tax=Clostridium botulinum TaxID=1491 RepID=UPI0004D628F6|nr:hypothetical protein [Clostridium botulinum]KEI04984.1 hypothetical protein Z952_05475 [Clostridium botulinum C/D str. BKT75002]KEI11828.1 hypothetical protein Z954_06660 [Clostridium botulinum C/D str. BKT2873]KGM93958.1 hypothetical protein Z956_09820 [Clostridium botulinum D str. CCUG 7971]KOC46389.1 hypothetical protein ADU88_11905 [Clostridium botulinum]NFO98479.1 hypothetical protein [Clostridium botulinum]